MEWLSNLFSSGADVSRVNPIGLLLMAAAAVLIFLAESLARRIHPAAPDRAQNAIKITGLIICAGGALLAILG